MHGESFRGDIQSLAELRMYLTVRLGGFSNEEQVRALAREHLPLLEQFDLALYEELTAILLLTRVLRIS